MTQGVILALGADQKWTVLSLPDTQFSKQRALFRKLKKDLPGGAVELQLWSSATGRVKRIRTRGSPVKTEAKPAERKPRAVTPKSEP